MSFMYVIFVVARYSHLFKQVLFLLSASNTLCVHIHTAPQKHTQLYTYTLITVIIKERAVNLLIYSVLFILNE